MVTAKDQLVNNGIKISISVGFAPYIALSPILIYPLQFFTRLFIFSDIFTINSQYYNSFNFFIIIYYGSLIFML